MLQPNFRFRNYLHLLYSPLTARTPLEFPCVITGVTHVTGGAFRSDYCSSPPLIVPAVIGTGVPDRAAASVEPAAFPQLPVGRLPSRLRYLPTAPSHRPTPALSAPLPSPTCRIGTIVAGHGNPPGQIRLNHDFPFGNFHSWDWELPLPPPLYQNRFHRCPLDSALHPYTTTLPTCL